MQIQPLRFCPDILKKGVFGVVSLIADALKKGNFIPLFITFGIKTGNVFGDISGERLSKRSAGLATNTDNFKPS